jgi:hypothetical protein
MNHLSQERHATRDAPRQSLPVPFSAVATSTRRRTVEFRLTLLIVVTTPDGWSQANFGTSTNRATSSSFLTILRSAGRLTYKLNSDEHSESVGMRHRPS